MKMACPQEKNGLRKTFLRFPNKEQILTHTQWNGHKTKGKNPHIMNSSIATLAEKEEGATIPS